MSVATALTALGERLRTITSPAVPIVYDNPAEAVSLGNFPCIVLALAPGDQARHEWRRKAGHIGIHKYEAALWLFVGSRQAPLPELHARILSWPSALADALAPHLTLDGAVSFIGDGNPTGLLFSYQIGPIEWGDGVYFGLRATLPVSEVVQQAFGQ